MEKWESMMRFSVWFGVLGWDSLLRAGESAKQLDMKHVHAPGLKSLVGQMVAKHDGCEFERGDDELVEN